MTEAILSVHDLLVKRGGVAVLDIPSFAIMPGEILSLIGPNGAGKSTLLLALSCLLKPYRGEIIFHGQPMRADHNGFHYRRKIAMVFQEPLLFDATVYENVASGLKIRGLGRREIRSMVMTALDRFGITHLEKRAARKLSGGEAQRTSLARAFAIRPEVIFLDEPFSSLDPPTREALIDDLGDILRETKTTAVMATHDQLEALMLSDRVAVMTQGKIVQTGTLEEVMNHPADEFIASFVGTETILAGKVTVVSGGVLMVAVGDRQIKAVGICPPGAKVLCCIRPENVILSTHNAEGDTSVRNTFAGMICKIVPMKIFHKVCLDCGFPLVAYVTIQSSEGLDLKAGSPVYASFKATAVHVIRKES